MSLRRPFDAVGPKESCVEPLRRVWRGDLFGEHELHFVVEGSRIDVGAVEVSVFCSPVGPCPCEAGEDLFCAVFSCVLFFFVQGLQFVCVWDGASSEVGNSFFWDTFEGIWDAFSSEVFLREDVCSCLRPAFGDFDIFLFEDDIACSGAQRCGDAMEGDGGVGGGACARVVAGDFQDYKPL